MIGYLNRTIDWYHHVQSLGEATGSSQDQLFRESVRQQTHDSVGLGFKFARAQAKLLDDRSTGAPVAPAGGDARAQRIAQSLAAANARVTDLQHRLDALDAQIADGAATTRPALDAVRRKIAAELDLATARKEAVTDFSAFTTQAAGGTDSGVTHQVEDLARTVPEAADAALIATTQPSRAGEAESFRPESAGIIRLITEMFSLSGQINEITQLTNQTADLSKANDALLNPLRSELTAAVSRGDALAASRPVGDEAAISEQETELTGLASRFRGLAGALVPLGEQKVMLDRTHATLAEWRGAVGREYSSIVRHLVIRCSVIGGVILIVLLISAVWRRATFRYVHDARRQRQFLLLRRIVVGILITLVVVAGFVAEFGSLATFAGIITAGIAVAMQTVILSAFAYFFYIGRYGVRVGDRVTVGGVTGDVVDVGLFRLYLMELGGNHLKQKPTGRVAVFSNSVLFAATGFFRQVPGADYAWHEVALTLAPEGDYKLAEQRLITAINSVFDKSRDELTRQHAIASRAFHVPVPDPKPEGRLRFIEAGLEFVVRYPVELRSAAETDDAVTRAIMDAIDHEPKLKLVVSGTPSVQSVE